MSTGSQPKEQIAACPICVLPRKPQRPIPATLDTPPDTTTTTPSTTLAALTQRQAALQTALQQTSALQTALQQQQTGQLTSAQLRQLTQNQDTVR